MKQKKKKAIERACLRSMIALGRFPLTSLHRTGMAAFAKIVLLLCSFPVPESLHINTSNSRLCCVKDFALLV